MKTYSTLLNLERTDLALLVFRISLGGLMLPHGYAKLLKLFGNEEIAFADPFGVGAATTLTLAVFSEFICSILIILGLGTRLAAWPLIITMVVAVFLIHANDGMQAQELPLLYMFCFLVLYLTGSGKYSLDHYFLQQKKQKN